MKRCFVVLALACLAAPANAGADGDPCAVVPVLRPDASAAEVIRAAGVLERTTVAPQACPAVTALASAIVSRGLEVGDLDHAVGACEYLTHRAGGVPRDVRVGCARAYAFVGEVAKATVLLEAQVAEAGEDRPGRVRALVGAARVLEERFRFSAAAEFVGRAVREAPEDPELGLRWVENLLEAGQGAAAGSASVEVAGRLPELRRELAKRLVQRGAAKHAVALVEGLAATGVREDLDAAVSILAGNRDRKGARETVRRFVREGAAGDQRGRALVGADVLDRQGLSLEAAETLEEALGNLAAAAPDAVETLGGLLLRAGRAERAIAVLDRAFELGGRSLEAGLRIADLLQRFQQHRAAAALLRRIADVPEARRVELALRVGRALRDAGDADGEEAFLAQAAEGLAAAADLWQAAGETWMKSGDSRRALTAFRRASDSATSDRQRALGAIGAAEALLAKGTASVHAEAETELRGALASAGDAPDLIARIEAAARRIPGSAALTRGVIQAALRQNPGRNELWLRLAALEVENGNGDGALEAYRRATSSSGEPGQLLIDAIDRLAAGGMVFEAIRLIESVGKGVRASPDQAGKLATRCLRLDVVACGRQQAEAFLEGPLDVEYDYLVLGGLLSDARLWELAERAFQLAAKRPDVAKGAVPLARGRMELARGREDKASALFDDAVREGNAETALDVARSWRAQGRMALSVAAYERAMKVGDAVAIVPEAVDALVRAGRRDQVPTLVAAVPDGEWRGARRLIPVAAVLVTAGFPEAARSLLERVLGSFPSSDRVAVESLRVLLALGVGGDALDSARDACLSEGVGGRSCELLASGLAERGRLAEAIAVYRGVLRMSPEAQAARVGLAEALVWSGDTDGALGEALQAAALASLTDELRDKMVRLFTKGRHWDHAVRLLEQLRGRNPERVPQEVVFESVRVLARAGRSEQASALLHAWVAEASGRELEAYRLLVRSGIREPAERLVTGLNVSTIQDADRPVLGFVLNDLLEHGRRDLVDRIIQSGVEGVPPERVEAMALILNGLGWEAHALSLLEAVPEQARSNQGSIEYAGLLARAGRIDAAYEVARRVLTGNAAVAADLRERLIRSLLIEGVSTGALATLVGEGSRQDGAGDAALVQARLVAAEGTPDALAAGRKAFVRGLQGRDVLPSPALAYIRTEARLGTLAGLFPVVAPLPGRAAAQAKILVACLSGDARLEREARALVEAGGTDASWRMASAVGWFECGRWDEARAEAEAALDSKAGGRDPGEVAVTVVLAGAVSGKDRTNWVKRHLRDRTDDRLQRQEREIAVHLARGDDAGAAKLMAARAGEMPGDERGWIGAVRLGLRGGEDGVVSRAVAATLATPLDIGATLQGLEDVFRGALRDERVVGLLEARAQAAPRDASVAERRMLAAFQAGDDALGLQTAEAYLAAVGDQDGALAFVVGRAAATLSVPVVSRFLPRLLESGRDAAAARGILGAALLRFRMGDVREGHALVDRAAVLGGDPVGLVSAAARAAVGDPGIPHDVPDRMIQARRRAGLDDDRMSARLESLPMVVASRCLGGAAQSAAVASCAKALDAGGFQAASLLVTGGRRAVSQGRFEVGEAAFLAAAERNPSRLFGRSLAFEIIESVGDRFEVSSHEARQRLGAFALKRMGWRGAVIDPEALPLVAQLVEASQGHVAARRLLEEHLAVQPSDASGWNSLAYLLSMAGADLGDAQRFVRKASALDPSENGYFLETEAWIRFRAGDARGALPLQRRAERLWTRDLGSSLAESLGHLGRILEALGRKGEAAAAYRQAVVRGPDTEHGRRALRRWVDLFNATH